MTMGLNRLLHSIADRLGAADLHEEIDKEIDADVEKESTEKDTEKVPEVADADDAKGEGDTPNVQE